MCAKVRPVLVWQYRSSAVLSKYYITRRHHLGAYCTVVLNTARTVKSASYPPALLCTSDRKFFWGWYLQSVCHVLRICMHHIYEVSVNPAVRTVYCSTTDRADNTGAKCEAASRPSYESRYTSYCLGKVQPVLVAQCSSYVGNTKTYRAPPWHCCCTDHRSGPSPSS